MYCSYCGKPNSDDFRFCSSCGKARSTGTPQLSTYEQKRQELADRMSGALEAAIKDEMEEKEEILIPKATIDEIQVQLTNAVSDALKQKKISLAESQDALVFIKEYLPKSSNLMSLEMFLLSLSVKWKIFADIYTDFMKQS